MGLVLLGVVAVVTGVALLAGRRGKRAMGAALLLGVLTTGLLVATPHPAEAGSDCSAPTPAPSETETSDTTPTPTTTGPTGTGPTSTPTTPTATPTATTGSPTATPTTPTSTPTSTPTATTTGTPTGTPTGEPTPEGCTAVNDKSQTRDTDGDRVVDACDLDSDNDGILDSIEDTDDNGRFENDDTEGVYGPTVTLGDGTPSYLDLDSDNDAILDLFESGVPNTQLAALDVDRNGIIDANQQFGANGFADVLETSPDSGVPTFALRNTDGDDKADVLDLTSNAADFDLYAVGRADLDDLGVGYVSRLEDPERDGIPTVIDTDLVNRGAPGSPWSPYGT